MQYYRQVRNTLFPLDFIKEIAKLAISSQLPQEVDSRRLEWR
jgi:hypothetical protein